MLRRRAPALREGAIVAARCIVATFMPVQKRLPAGGVEEGAGAALKIQEGSRPLRVSWGLGASEETTRR